MFFSTDLKSAIANQPLAQAIARSARNPRSHVWPLVLLALGCTWLYGEYIIRVYASADYPPAVSYAMNFKIAFDHGQWLPRLVEFPREFQVGMGSVDGTVPTADAPVFQYYAFLASALAYPFLSLGVPAPNAVGCVILLAYLTGMLALYWSAIVLGASRGVAVLATWSYLVSPWLVSNIYGRGGVAEGVAQALMPMIVLGMAWAWTGRYRAAIIMTALGIAAMALAHNIFLLYGATLAVLIMGAAFVASYIGVRPRSAQSWRDLLSPGLAVAAGLALGLAITAWQWVPAYQSLADTTFADNLDNAIVPMAFSGMSGIFGLPSRFYYQAVNSTPFFFTIGWWSIPSLAAAVILCDSRRRCLALAVAVIFSVFFFACYFPYSIFPYLPRAYAATQFTFRLLSLLSLCGALALCLIRTHIRTTWVALLLLAITLSQTGVIYYRLPVFRYSDIQYQQGWEVNAFSRSGSFTEAPLRKDQLGTIMNDNMISLRRWRAITGYPKGPLFIRLVGESLPKAAPFELAVENPVTCGTLAMKNVSELRFDLVLPVDTTAANIHVSVPQADLELGVIKPKRMYLISAPLTSYIYDDEISKISGHGLTRSFLVKPERVASHQPSANGDYVIEIPMVGNRFLVARQGDKLLTRWSDLNNRLNVRVSDLELPVTVSYEISRWIWALVIAGLVLVAAVSCTRSRK